MRRSCLLAAAAVVVVGPGATALAAGSTIDDRALTRSGAWASVTSAKALKRTLTRSRKAGAALEAKTAATNGGVVTFQSGPRRGTARILVGGRQRASVRTAAKKVGPKRVSFSGAGKVRIVVGRQGRGVYVDAIRLNAAAGGAGGSGPAGPGGSTPGSTTPTPTPTPAPTKPPAVNPGALTQVNTDAAGAPADADVVSAAVSPNGTYVAFWSKATNLVPGVDNGSPHLYLKTLADGAIRVLDAAQDGTLSNDVTSAGGARPVAWAPDSSEVLFSSSATNLGPDTTGLSGPLLYAKALSDNSVGLLFEGVTDAAWSPDGTKIVFGTQFDYCGNAEPPCTASNINGNAKLYSWTIGAPKVVAVSATAAGQEASDGTGPTASYRPVWSPDSQSVAFVSDSHELVPDDTNAAADIFVKNLTTRALTRASTTASGSQADGGSNWPAYSPDGTRIAFDSRADNLVAGDNNSGDDVFVKTLATGAVSAASAEPSGEFKLFKHQAPKWSPDGTKIAFTSESVGLIDGYVDSNQRGDIYIRDLASGTFQIASGRPDGVIGNGSSTLWFLYGSSGGWLPDSKSLIFLSNSTNFADDGNAFQPDLFRKVLG